MILAVSIVNNFGKCRFMKLFGKHMVRGRPPTARPSASTHARTPFAQPEAQQQLMVKELFSTLSARA